MSDYSPDRWAILKIIDPKTNKALYKVLAGWNGGYLDEDSWKINSGITKIEQDENGFHYYGYSGSVYHCNHHAYGTTMLSQSMYEHYKKIAEENGLTFEMLSEDEAFALKI